ncbi:hypothetical protein C4579_04365 [Candidatus Microgenomates bacterium]|nr:MAG: hypothetical protein C4579_04365 [Candidatus Microgenomates bacterium]
MAQAELEIHQRIEKRKPQSIRNVIFDADSTLSAIEGIDWLAELHGVEHQTAILTKQAMNGEIVYDDVFPKRLEIIQPTWQEIEMLGRVYIDHLTKGAITTVDELHRRRYDVFIISGGFNPAIGMLGEYLNIPPQHIFANHLNGKGRYSGFQRSPLCGDHGKAQTIRFLRLWYPGGIAIVDDGFGGVTAGADMSFCYTGVVERPKAMQVADRVITSLEQVLDYV